MERLVYMSKATLNEKKSMCRNLLKKYWKVGKHWKSQGKVREFCHSEKVATLDLILVVCVLIFVFP